MQRCTKVTYVSEYSQPALLAKTSTMVGYAGDVSVRTPSPNLHKDGMRTRSHPTLHVQDQTKYSLGPASWKIRDGSHW